MSYEVLILRKAQKELAELPKSDYERLRDAIAGLAVNPRPVGCKKNWLVAKAGESDQETVGPFTKSMT